MSAANDDVINCVSAPSHWFRWLRLILSQPSNAPVAPGLINKGISASRLTAKGYGETQLLNNCANDIKCTELEHQINRRTEFLIIE